MPELGGIDDKRLAALAGFAPINCDSGRKTGKAHIKGGRKPLPDVLYQAALIASKHNSQLKELADRLKKNGKPHKLVITAGARELIVIANPVVRRNSPWIPVI